MAEITSQRSGELLRVLFAILMEHADGIQARDALAELDRRVELTEFESGSFPGSPGQRRFEKLVRFYTINTVKAGWMTKQKGRWFITEEGQLAYRSFLDPEQFMEEAKRLYRKWAKEQPAPTPVIEDDSPSASSTLEEAEEAASASIQKHLEDMNAYDFQDLIAALLRAMGYHVNWVAPPGPDDGIDIVAFADPLGVRGPRMKVQVKHHQSKADVDSLRSFIAVLSDQDVGIFINAGGFTSGAEREARRQPSRRLTLIDLPRLVDLWIEHYRSMDEADRTRLPLKPVYYLAPIEASG